MTLAAKLGSLVVHADEFIETSEPLDRQAIFGLLSDTEVQVFLDELDSQALIPVKRASR